MPGKKILVADDSLTIQKVIRLALSNEGYEIQAVSDGNEAIQQMSTFRPDVILVDVALPGKTAFELKGAVNGLGDFQNVKFILMSSAFEKVDEEQANQVGFHGRLTKPFDPGHLRQVIVDALAIADVAPPEAPASGHTPPEFPETPPAYSPPDFLSEESPPAQPPGIPPSMPGVPEHPVNPASEDSDIKQLTESTIRMSGLDDFEWNIQEPSLKPSPAMMDLGDTNFQMGSPTFPEPGLPPEHGSQEHLEHGEQPHEPPSQPPPLKHSSPSATPPSFETFSSLGFPGSPPSAPSPGSEFELPPVSSGHADPGVLPLAPGDVEEIIRAQVKEEIERMAKKILPEVAEKVIKQEIHRLLSELS